MTNEAKYNKGDKANYYGNEATINKATWNVFSKAWDYSISYSEKTPGYPTGLRKGQTGVQQYELK